MLIYEPQNHASAPTNCVAKLKAIDPIMSTSAPSSAQVLHYDDHGAKVKLDRYLPPRTLVQLHLGGKFSLWTVQECERIGRDFYLDLKLTKLVAPQ